jgi:hypothetical protein
MLDVRILLSELREIQDKYAQLPELFGGRFGWLSVMPELSNHFSLANP